MIEARHPNTDELPRFERGFPGAPPGNDCLEG